MSPRGSEEAKAPGGEEDKRPAASYLTSLERTAAGIRHYDNRGLCSWKREGQKRGSDVESSCGEMLDAGCESKEKVVPYATRLECKN